jgi:hypothetical protein
VFSGVFLFCLWQYRRRSYKRLLCRVVSDSESDIIGLQGDSNLVKHSWAIEYQESGILREAVVDYIGGRDEFSMYRKGDEAYFDVSVSVPGLAKVIHSLDISVWKRFFYTGLFVVPVFGTSFFLALSGVLPPN